MNLVKNGTPGVGKTTVSKALHQKLHKSVWLDGDWCWMMNPWIITEENTKVVEGNITYLLRSFLENSNFDYILFNWVLHREEYKLTRITLTCSDESLRNRMLLDNRTVEQIESSCNRLKLYEEMITHTIDTTGISTHVVVTTIQDLLKI
ncbi:AAA family ATPase [Paenibacillus tianjinensis]|uniref:AAA family ATPase n=1 Tax=Paenibacillus tianjinensis TaxID=2810347 RepID=A0ABX7LFV6_9BACL|nr:AAA family ATPase [Paenibacillus tianjinensis]QSF46985.1 AAA family ATPase [Paenibacillus tianjinensis]